MKKLANLLSITFILFLFLIAGCESNKDDPAPAIDCDQANLEVNAESQPASGCATNDGSVTASAQGQGEIEYSINGADFQASGSFTGLAAGNYTITVRNENQCMATTAASVGVAGSNLPIVNVTATDAGCNTSNGEITVDATGEGTLMYMLGNGSFQSSNRFTNLPAGDYSIIVKDASNCEISTEKQILNGTSYEQQVKSIIQTNCAVSGCHNGANGASRNWTVFDNVQDKALTIKAFTQNGTMPPPGSGQTLTETEKDLIACWVDDGAMNN